MINTLRCAIVGPTGYTGRELIEWLARHPKAEVRYLASHRSELPDIRDEFPRLQHTLSADVAQCRPIDYAQMAKEVDVAFLALPHGASFEYTQKLRYEGVTVIDLSPDYRLKCTDLYARTYGLTHGDEEGLAQAVYGLPELFRGELRGATLVANPGCYPTAAALALAPLLAQGLIRSEGIHINAASGVSGAGRKPSLGLHFTELQGAFGAYGAIGGHRHQPEISQTLTRMSGHEVTPLFVPHLLPFERGIFETIYVRPADDAVTIDDIHQAYQSAYANEPFVRLRDRLPNIAHVAGTPYCDLAAFDTPAVAGGQGKQFVLFSVIDNLLKGASGQAIQNMNAIFGLPETTGLLP